MQLAMKTLNECQTRGTSDSGLLPVDLLCFQTHLTSANYNFFTIHINLKIMYITVMCFDGV